MYNTTHQLRHRESGGFINMVSSQIPGYAGRLLRIDLNTGAIKCEMLSDPFLKMFPGGTCLGIKFIYDEVPQNINWDSPQNRLFIGSGPLGGTRIAGSGSIAVVTKGALTNGMTSTQANGFFGTFLKMSGFDAVLLHGALPDWSYIYIHDGFAEIREAKHLLGKDTFEVDQIIKGELGKKDRQMSVLCIGPAAEKL